MREVFSDFFRRETLPDGRVRIPLGAEQDAPDLLGLHDGDEVRLLMPGELHAIGQVQSVVVGDYTMWYAILPSMDAIQLLEPESGDILAPQQSEHVSSPPLG